MALIPQGSFVSPEKNFPMEAIAKLKKGVTPAKAGVQKLLKRLDSSFRRNDKFRL
jgi:hypothetical protein